jgi:hypothetical protein
MAAVVRPRGGGSMSERGLRWGEEENVEVKI